METETILKVNNPEEINSNIDIKKKMLAAIVNDNEGIQTYCIIRNENVLQEKLYWKNIVKYLLSSNLFKNINSNQEFIKEKDVLETFDKQCPIYVMTVDIDTLIEEE